MGDNEKKSKRPVTIDNNISVDVGDFEGYLEVMDVRLNNIPATIDEINEIYELLKGGIII